MDGNSALLRSWKLSLHDNTERTRDLYLANLRRLIDWTAENRDGQSLLELRRRDIEEYLDELRTTPTRRGAPPSQSTIRSHWIALRTFYGWALDEEEIDASPMDKIKVAKANPEPVRVLSDDEVAALLAQCTGRDFYDRRDSALIRVLEDTGLRVSELASMTVDELDLEDRSAVIHGKGKTHRRIRFSPETAKALDRYLRRRAGFRSAHLPALWLGHRGPLTRKGVPVILNKRAEQARQAGLDVGHVHPHAFRHRFAHTWLDAGGTEGDLKRLGGWSSDQVMRRYGSSLAEDRALAAYDRIRGDR